jgi:hypothetical protein
MCPAQHDLPGRWPPREWIKVTDNTVPQSARDLWLSVARAVIDGLPAPGELTLYRPNSVWILFEDQADARVWAEHLGMEPTSGTASALRDDGWLWHVKGKTPRTVKP